MDRSRLLAWISVIIAVSSACGSTEVGVTSQPVVNDMTNSDGSIAPADATHVDIGLDDGAGTADDVAVDYAEPFGKAKHWFCDGMACTWEPAGRTQYDAFSTFYRARPLVGGDLLLTGYVDDKICGHSASVWRVHPNGVPLWRSIRCGSKTPYDAFMEAAPLTTGSKAILAYRAAYNPPQFNNSALCLVDLQTGAMDCNLPVNTGNPGLLLHGVGAAKDGGYLVSWENSGDGETCRGQGILSAFLPSGQELWTTASPVFGEITQLQDGILVSGVKAVANVNSPTAAMFSDSGKLIWTKELSLDDHGEISGAAQRADGRIWLSLAFAHCEGEPFAAQVLYDLDATGQQVVRHDLGGDPLAGIFDVASLGNIAVAVIPSMHSVHRVSPDGKSDLSWELPQAPCGPACLYAAFVTAPLPDNTFVVVANWGDVFATNKTSFATLIRYTLDGKELPLEE